MRRAALLLALPLAACAAPQGVEEAASPIVGGAPDTGDPAVVMLVSHPPDQSTFDACTASLIAPKVLLTAAHCLDAQKHPGYVFGAFTGPDASAYTTAALLAPHLAPIAEVHIHPSYDPKPPFTADIGVAILKDPLDVTPLPVNRAPLDAKIEGSPARIVGYGQIKYGELHLAKSEAATVIEALGADDTIVVGDLMHRSCVGDSGGPALVKIGGVETIVGVDSYAETSGCLEPAHYRRPDRTTDFLDTYAPPPAPPDAGAGGAGGTGTGTGAGESGGGGTGGGSQSPTPEESGGCAVTRNRESQSLGLFVPLAIFAIARRARRRGG